MDLRFVAGSSGFCYQGGMDTVINLLRDLWNALRCVGELLGYLRDVMGRISDHPAHRLAELLPGNWRPAESESTGSPAESATV